MQSIRSQMLSAKAALFVLPLVIALFLLGPTPGSAVDKSDEPTVENMLKAKQAGDLEKAARIQTILNEKAKKSWRSPGGDEIVVESPYPIPSQRDNAFCKSSLWDNDRAICTGPVSGGISVDYDTSGNIYAARCSTWQGANNACVLVYKSTDGGVNWSYLADLHVGPTVTFSHPVVLTGSTGDKLYLFLLRSDQNGMIQMLRFSQSGTPEGIYYVKAGTDTITYFSACVDYENGDHLMVVYQKEEMGDDTPDLYTITSTDYGETWNNEVLVYAYGSHPDIAYGRNGYVYLVFEWPGGGDYDIGFIRSTDYCSPGSWVDLEALTDDSYDDTYPKVAALHTLPDSIPYVWVAYNDAPVGAYTPMNLGYAYSCNGGEFWSKNHILDSSTVWNEMACDLWTKRSSGYPSSYVNVCYFKGGHFPPFYHAHIFYGRVSSTNPTYWGWLHEKATWPTQSEDGREICQGTYAQGNCAIMWAGKDPPGDPFGDDFQNLYFTTWPTDVEEEMTEEEVPAKFSLSSNYPNPFNPETRIEYFIPLACHVRLDIFNVLGQHVRTIVDEDQVAGEKTVAWDGKNQRGETVTSGIYLYRLEAGEFIQSKKMILIR